MSEAAQTEEHRVTLDDPLARLPRIDIGYKGPAASSADYDALSVLSTILSGGRSSRFYESIVRGKQLATSVNAFIPETRGPALFTIIASPAPRASVADVEAAISAELDRIKTGPITDAELEKARSSAERGAVSVMGSTLGRAVYLSQDAIFYNQPDRFTHDFDRIAKVTAADVQRVAAKYLVPTNRTVVVSSPKAPARGGL